VLALGRRAALILTSDLPRAVASAQRIGSGAALEVGPLWRETELPRVDFGWPKLPLPVLAVSVKLAWSRGYGTACESFPSACRRAERAAAVLEERTADGSLVLVVGHGVFNGLLAAALRHRGWRGPARPPSKHWGAASYLIEDG
jgi:broad specificity phosphatase PhoE